MLLGAHCSTAGGVHQALERATAIGGEVAQIFVKNNLQWRGRPFARAEIERYQATRKASGLRLIFGHTGYLINLGAPPSANRDRSVASLIHEIELAAQLELPFLVLHPGAHLGAGEAQGLRQAIAGLDEVLRATRRSKVNLALEVTAGQGTGLGHRLAHLVEILQRAQSPERLDLCLDTAHLFAAGYDLRQAAIWDAVIDEIHRGVGVEKIVAVHLNDSKAALGSRVDRHAGIGEGKIGKAGFRHLLNDPRFALHPGCLETPKSADLHEDVANLAVLRSLLKRRRPGRPRPGRGRSAS
jgi:deoxyribonuclease-4